MFTAYHRGDYLHEAPTLDAVLDFVRDVNDPVFGEDTVIWQGCRIAAVFLSGGACIKFSIAAPPLPAVEMPADLARLTDTAAA
jgi:hypothetical protein